MSKGAPITREKFVAYFDACLEKFNGAQPTHALVSLGNPDSDCCHFEFCGTNGVLQEMVVVALKYLILTQLGHATIEENLEKIMIVVVAEGKQIEIDKGKLH